MGIAHKSNVFIYKLKFHEITETLEGHNTEQEFRGIATYIDIESKIEIKIELGSYNELRGIDFSPIKPNIVVVKKFNTVSTRTNGIILNISDETNTIKELSEFESAAGGSYNFINNDRLIYQSNYVSNLNISILDENYNSIKTTSKTMGTCVISADGLYVLSLSSAKIYTLVVDYETGEITIEYLRDFPSIVETTIVNEDGKVDGVMIREAYLNGAGNILWVIEAITGDDSLHRQDRIRVYSVDFNSENVLNFLFSTRGDFLKLSADREAISLTGNTVLSTVKDFSKLVALKYEGSYFYRQDPGVLTARPADVTKGVTFIGRNGIPENGTLEV